MYIKQTTLRRGTRSYTYAALVQAYRVGVTVKHRTIVNLGRIDNPNAPASFVLPLLKIQPVFVSGIARLYALPMAIHAIWNELGIGSILKATLGKTVTTNVTLLTELMIIGRMLNPDSKLSLTRWYNKLYLPEKLPQTIDVHDFYRCLDYLLKHKEAIEKQLYYHLQKKQLIDPAIVFYDLTSSYFEGEHVAMAAKGYSRDHRADCLQITLGLVIDRKNGLPLYHEVFEGNTADSATVKGILTKLTDRFAIKDVIFVADKGMLTPDNLKELEEKKYQSILSESVRNALSQKQRKELFLKIGTFTRLKDQEEALWYTETKDKEGKKIIVCYNQYTAARAKQTRDEKIKKQEKYIRETKEKHKDKTEKKEIQKTRDMILAKLVTAHARKYFDRQEKESVADLFPLKKDVVTREEHMDGMWGIRSNAENLTTEELIKTYKDLKTIEASFRVIKDVIELRPIYHHKDDRVKGHVFICILAFLITRILEKKAGKTMKMLKEEYMTSVIIPGQKQTEQNIVTGGESFLQQLAVIV